MVTTQKKSIHIRILFILAVLLVLGSIIIPRSIVAEDNGSSSSSSNQTNANLSYSEILSASEIGVLYEPEILNEFNKTSEVAVIVELSIPISNTTSKITNEQEIKEETSGILARTDSVLSTLSENEFKLKRQFLGGGFSGDITKAGFNKLLNNSNVSKIFLNKPNFTGGLVTTDTPIERNESANQSVAESLEPLNKSIKIPEVKVESNPDKVSFFSRIIQFLKSLFDWNK